MALKSSYFRLIFNLTYVKVVSTKYALLTTDVNFFLALFITCDNLNHFNATGIACIMELLAEPLYILSQNLLLLRLRMVVESMATLLRCLTIFILVSKKNNMVIHFFKCLFCQLYDFIIYQ